MNNVIRGVVVVVFTYVLLKWRPQFVKNYNILPHPQTLAARVKLQAGPAGSGRPVYVYMSLDYPQLPEYGKYSIELIETYCNLHGYTFQVFDHSSEAAMSPYWIRVKDLHALLGATPPNSLVMYLDLDATVHPDHLHTRLETLVGALDSSTSHAWDMYAAVDPGFANFEMNTGIIIAKNTEWSKSFVRTWLANYPDGFWQKGADDTWTCSIPSTAGVINRCLWAGDEYEQGMFNRLYQRNVLGARRHILPVHTSLFGNKDATKPSFVVHLMGHTNKARARHFKEYFNRTASQR
jgi:hypothetical protein